MNNWPWMSIMLIKGIQGYCLKSIKGRTTIKRNKGRREKRRILTRDKRLDTVTSPDQQRGSYQYCSSRITYKKCSIYIFYNHWRQSILCFFSKYIYQTIFNWLWFFLLKIQIWIKGLWKECEHYLVEQLSCSPTALTIKIWE